MGEGGNRFKTYGEDEGDKAFKIGQVLRMSQWSFVILGLLSAIVLLIVILTTDSGRMEVLPWDATISKSLNEDTVPEWTIIIFVLVAVAVPWITELFVSHTSRAHRIFVVFNLFLGLVGAFCFTFMGYGMPNHYVGRPRPDFMERCQPDDDWECTSDRNVWEHGYTSFPSGHSAFSFCPLMYAALYLAWTFWIRDSKGQAFPPPVEELSCGAIFINQFLDFFKFFSIFALIYTAWFVAVSRIRDNRHFPEDVLAGALCASVASGFALLSTVSFLKKWYSFV